MATRLNETAAAAAPAVAAAGAAAPAAVPPPPTTTSTTTRDWRRMTRTLAHYERIEQIGEGTYGQVYKARCLDTGRVVALKKIHVHHGGYWGMPPTVIREIKILKRLVHPRLVQMVEVVSSKGVEYLEEHDEAPTTGALSEKKKKKSNKTKDDRIVDAREGYKGNLYLVLEYVSHDLTGLLDVAYRFTEQQVKCIFRQLLEALQYMHDQKYIHRDIKSSNILIDEHFRLKLADFGLARSFCPPILENIHDRGTVHEFTNKVITLWYRPPEILLGATRYGPAVDMWSAGCILAELMLGRPLFTGKTEMEQLQQIFDLLGTPTADSWEGFTDLKLMRTGEVTIETPHRPPKLRNKYGHKMPLAAMNLLEKLLELDPKKRLTASRALASRYFLMEPRPPDRPEDLGILQLGTGGGHFHEFQTKKKRREAKALAKTASNDARARGMSEKDAEAEFDAVYRECMKRVAEEGNKALITEVERREMERKEKEKIDEDTGLDDVLEKTVAAAVSAAAKTKNGREGTEQSGQQESKDEMNGKSGHTDDTMDGSDRKDVKKPLDRGNNDVTSKDRSSRAPQVVTTSDNVPSASGETKERSSQSGVEEDRNPKHKDYGFSPDPEEEARKSEKSRKRSRKDSRDRRDRHDSRSRRSRDDSRERKRSRKASKRDHHSSSSRRSKGHDKHRDRHKGSSRDGQDDRYASHHEEGRAGRYDDDLNRPTAEGEQRDGKRRDNRDRSELEQFGSPHGMDVDRRERNGGDNRGGPPPFEAPSARDRRMDEWNGPPRQWSDREDRVRRKDWGVPPPDRRGPPPGRLGRFSPPRDGRRNDRIPPRGADYYGPPEQAGSRRGSQRGPLGPVPPSERFQQVPPGARGPSLPPMGYQGDGGHRERHRDHGRGSRRDDRNRPRR